MPKGQSQAAWRCVGHRIAERERQGKKSKVVIDGIVYDERNVAKEIGRNQPSTLEKVQQGKLTVVLIMSRDLPSTYIIDTNLFQDLIVQSLPKA